MHNISNLHKTLILSVLSTNIDLATCLNRLAALKGSECQANIKQCMLRTFICADFHINIQEFIEPQIFINKDVILNEFL